MLVGTAPNCNPLRFASLFKRFINCNSCGVELQSTNAHKKGYFTKRVENSDLKKPDINQIKYAMFSQDIQRLTANHETDKERKVESPPICKRCNDALHQNKYKVEDFGKFTYNEIMRNVPEQGNIMHLVSLPEFPLGLNSDLLHDKRYNVDLVLTKADQVIGTKSILQKEVPSFLKGFLKYHLDIVTNKGLAVSSVKSWNLDTLYSLLKSRTYLMGDANAGKSSLINALIKKYVGRRMFFDKKGNMVPNNKYEVTDMKQHIKNNSAGVYHVPNMTRTLQAFNINEKVVFDLPGYTNDTHATSLENVIAKDWLQQIRKTELFDSKKIKKKHYVSIKGTENGYCYTVGGIFFLVPPKGTINQVVSYIPGQHSEFKSIDRALEVFRECNQPYSTHPLKNFCGLTDTACDKSRFVRHILPPFQGSIEVVMKDIGYFLLRSTGSYNFKGLYEIWLPKGIDICIREPLEKTIITNYRQFIDSKGKIPSCPRNRPIISSVYPMDHDESDVLNKMKEMYLERTGHDLSARRHRDTDVIKLLDTKAEENHNIYWYYKW